MWNLKFIFFQYDGKSEMRKDEKTTEWAHSLLIWTLDAVLFCFLVPSGVCLNSLKFES